MLVKPRLAKRDRLMAQLLRLVIPCCLALWQKLDKIMVRHDLIRWRRQKISKTQLLPQFLMRLSQHRLDATYNFGRHCL